MTQIPVRRALVSTYDKTGLEELGHGLARAGVELVSTGSTAARLRAAGVAVTPVEELTGFPECLDGRVKTLHPKVHAGILADRRLPEHERRLAELGIAPFDLVVVNLYPFADTVASGASPDECVEQIDIGGPTMVRAAAKNHPSVAVAVSPASYAEVLAAVAAGGFTFEQRRRLAARAFAHTASYDVAVASWFASAYDGSGAEQGFPDWLGATWERSAVLRYGENPHQGAALYVGAGVGDSLATAEQLHGKQMSYNNYVDTDAALRAAVSAFGGVIAVNRPVSVAMAEQVAEVFTEVVAAPAYDDGAVEVLARKPSIRVLRTSGHGGVGLDFRQVCGGVLLQHADSVDAPGDDPAAWTLQAGPAADTEMLADLEFAWRAVRAVRSNAILLASGAATVGVGMGQVNRVDAARLAVARAAERAQGAVAASDAFFPFADGLQVLLDAGVLAVVEPGGSVRDEAVVAAARAAGVTLYFTGTRHFAH